MDTTLTDEQMHALKLFHSYRASRAVFVITGGPGSGKTTLLKHMRSPFGDVKHVIVTPTAFAAERVKQATDFDAHVIGKVDFSEHLVSEYRGCILFIDEASMTSMNDVAMLLHELQPIKLVVLGDENQLPCINDHSLLDTLLRSESVHIVRLTKNLRQNTDGGSSALIKAISTIGRPSWDGEIEQDDSFRIFKFDTTQQAINAAADAFIERDGDAHMLSYTNDSVNSLNSKTVGTGRRRVACGRNVYGPDKVTLLVANGTRGWADTNGVVEYDNGFVDSRRRTIFNDARCLTVHKSQGSEFEEHGIIVPTWLKGGIPIETTYTGISRFRKSVAIYGSKAEVETALKGRFSVRSGDSDAVALLRAYKEEGFAKLQGSEVDSPRADIQATSDGHPPHDEEPESRPSKRARKTLSDGE